MKKVLCLVFAVVSLLLVSAVNAQCCDAPVAKAVVNTVRVAKVVTVDVVKPVGKVVVGVTKPVKKVLAVRPLKRVVVRVRVR